MRPVILILGPTAGGKTRLAIDLAHQLPGGAEIISCDSMQIYRGMDIGTAKPTPHLRAEMPHHLLDIVDPSDDTFSVDRWLELANNTIEAIRARRRYPIIVGGTNLYVQAFLSGMTSEGPPPHMALRAELNEFNLEQLRHRLQRADPAAAERIHPNDRKRTIRAIEVFETTGKRLSDLQTQWDAAHSKSEIRNPRPVLIIGLDYPVEIINRRINARVKSMIEAGFVEEVRRLHEARSFGRNAREALGYKQVIEHFEGHNTLEDAIEQIKIRTRRYAKQQRTWLRRFKSYPNSIWIEAAGLSPEELAEKAMEALRNRLALAENRSGMEERSAC